MLREVKAWERAGYRLGSLPVPNTKETLLDRGKRQCLCNRYRARLNGLRAASTGDASWRVISVGLPWELVARAGLADGRKRESQRWPWGRRAVSS